MLSYITNRTLIIPLILINYFPQSSIFYPLYNALNEIIEVKKYREDHCYKDDINSHNYCDDNYSRYDNFTMLNWDQLFD
jgi:hypothetical protein